MTRLRIQRGGDGTLFELPQGAPSASLGAIATALAPEMGLADTTFVEAPEVRFAKSGDVNIAYSMVGDGPFDLVFVGGWVLSCHEVVGGPSGGLLQPTVLLLPVDPVRQTRNRALRPHHRYSRPGDPDG